MLIRVDGLAPQTRFLLALIVVLVVAQVPQIVELVLASLLGKTTVGGLITTLDHTAWIRVLLAAGLLLLMVLTAVRILRQTETGRPSGWMALGAAIAAQALLVGGSVLLVARNTVTGVDAPR